MSTLDGSMSEPMEDSNSLVVTEPLEKNTGLYGKKTH